MDYDITINSDLSGKCVAKVLTMGVITKESVEDNLQSRGLKNYSVTEYTENVEMSGPLSVPVKGLQITTTWSDPGEVGSMLKKNDDGTVTVSMDYMASAGGKAVVKVEGKIDRDSTKGNIIGRDIVEFGSGQRIYFRFEPQKGIISGRLMPVAAAVGIIVLALAIILVARKRAVVPPQPASASPPDKVAAAQGKTFCAECGVEARPGDVFCAKCGSRLI